MTFYEIIKDGHGANFPQTCRPPYAASPQGVPDGGAEPVE